MEDARRSKTLAIFDLCVCNSGNLRGPFGFLFVFKNAGARGIHDVPIRAVCNEAKRLWMGGEGRSPSCTWFCERCNYLPLVGFQAVAE